MSKKSVKADIEFELDGVEYSLTPMKQKVAAHVFHSCLSRVLAAIAQAVSGETEEDKLAKLAASLPEVADFEDIWFILQNVMKHAMVDGHEIKSLDDSDVFDEYPHHMYLVVYHAIKGNWPGYFSKMEVRMSGFASNIKKSFQMAMDKETAQ